MHYPASDLVIDPVLIRKYDVGGPRYTSYPTADRFIEALGEADLQQWLARREVGELGHEPGRGVARIDLDRVLRARRALEAGLDRVHQRRHLVAAEEVRRAAAPVHLVNRAAAREVRREKRQFLLQVLDILG